MKGKGSVLAAVVLGLMLSACATTGTRVSTSSGAYRGMAKSQDLWCGTFPDSCGCNLDGMRVTCSLVQTCISSGSCSPAP